MELPHEIVYWDVLPAIRRELVLWLERLGLKRERIAEILEITPVAVHYYLRGKRGAHIVFPEDVSKRIRRTASKIVAGADPFVEIARVVRFVERSGFLCKLCNEKNGRRCTLRWRR